MLFIYAIIIGLIAGFVVSKLDPDRSAAGTLGTIVAGVVGALLPVIVIELAVMGDSAFPILEIAELMLGGILATINAFLFSAMYRVIARNNIGFSTLKKSFGYTPPTPQEAYRAGTPAYIGIKGGLTKKSEDEPSHEPQENGSDTQPGNRKPMQRFVR